MTALVSGKRAASAVERPSTANKFAVVGGWVCCFIGLVGVSNPPPSPQWKGVTFLVQAKPTKGGEILIFLTDEDGKRPERLLKVMTKLKGPRHQVTLSQIPSDRHG